MVRLKGPGQGLAASGSLANTLTFGTYMGRPYLKTKNRPRQPNTPPQLAMKAIMAFCSAQWKTFPQLSKDSWNARADTDNISPFNAYVAETLSRWRSFRRPSVLFPATEDGSIGAGFMHTATGLTRAIRFFWRCTICGNLWGQQFHHVDHNNDPVRWNTLRHIEVINCAGDYTYVVQPFEPGTVWIGITRFTTDGYAAPFTKWFSVVVQN